VAQRKRSTGEEAGWPVQIESIRADPGSAFGSAFFGPRRALLSGPFACDQVRNLVDNAFQFADRAAVQAGLKHLEQRMKIPKLLLRAALESVPNRRADLLEIVENGFRIVKFVGGGDDEDVFGFRAQARKIGVLSRLPAFLLVMILGECVGEAFHHARNVTAKFLLHLVERALAALVLGGVVKNRRDHHVFGDRNRATSLAHHQRCDSEQVGHVGDARALAELRVKNTRIVNGARESVKQDEGLRGQDEGLCGVFHLLVSHAAHAEQKFRLFLVVGQVICTGCNRPKFLTAEKLVLSITLEVDQPVSEGILGLKFRIDLYRLSPNLELCLKLPIS